MTSGTIGIRDLPPSCWPPSVRGDFDTIEDGLADVAYEGEVVNVGGVLYYFDGAELQPLVPPGAHVEIPDTAFADPTAPTTAEAETWIQANQFDARHNTVFYYPGVGTAEAPEYAWYVNKHDREVRQLQDPPSVVVPIGVIDVVKLTPYITTSADNSFANVDGATIVNYQWIVTNANTGVVYADINGAPFADATGETGVQNGTYNSPEWDINDACTPYTYQLIATDSLGQVSEPTEVLITGGGEVVDLAFTTTITTNPLYEMSFSFGDDYVAVVDMGDGTVYTSNDISHTYAAAGTYNITAAVCRDTLTEVQSPDNNLSGSISGIFAGDISQFENLQRYNFDNNNLTGSVPDVGLNPLMIEARADNNNLTGDPPAVLGATGLITYSFHGNQFTGELPYIAGNASIVTFDLGENNISGGWHDIAGNNSLVYYDIGDNDITDDVDDYQVSLSGKPLQYFDVSDNNFSGSDFNLKGAPIVPMIHFDASNNQLTGSLIVSEIDQMTNLEYFDYSNNMLTGDAPATTNQPNLMHYDISNNLFVGDARPTTNNPVLVYYSAANNDLTYPLGGLDRLNNTLLEHLDFSGNNSMVYFPGEITGANGALIYVGYGSTATAPPDAYDIYCDVDSAGTSGGTLVTTFLPPAPPPDASAVCFNNLSARGWTIIIQP